MKNTIIDSGPIIALFDKDDKYHQKLLNFMKKFDGKLITTWAVVTEVSHLLNFNFTVQLNFLKWIELDAITIYQIQQNELAELSKMMQKYRDLPMDLADSTLMYVAQKENIKNIISIDSDFDVYRTIKKQHLNNLLR